ncbi:MAG: ABC transporter permease [Bacteroidaceae bacterium]|nr:ABC transporter permease [Bacteroidaceae bacterium]
MNKILIVIEREFLTRIRKKSFILLTVLMPLLIVGIIFVPIILSTLDSTEQQNVAVVDVTGKYAPLLQDTGAIHFETVPAMTAEMQTEDSPYTSVIQITDDLNQDSTAATIYSHKEVSPALSKYFNSVVSAQIRADRKAEYNMPNMDEIVAHCTVDYEVRTIKWTKDGDEKLSNSTIAGFVGMLFTFLIYMFVMSYGGMVMQGVMEEKTNRIMELMVSSVKPFQMMMGKIIGIALVGLFQFLLWGALIAIVLAVAGSFIHMGGSEAIPMAEAMSGGVPVPDSPGAEILQVVQGMNFTEIVCMFILYFIGGYLLFASIFAAVGASINEQADSSQFMTPIVIIMIFSLYAGIFSIENPDGPLALWCSYIPFTSPIVMMVRLPFGVPAWQLALSLALLYATALGVVWLSAKIYRVGILMYGKKPSFKEMMRWVRFK